jgi:hypothetical protein
MPDFPQTRRRLAVMYEMFGNVDEAKKISLSYKNLVSTPAEKADADAQVSSLDPKAKEYGRLIDEAHSILTSLLERWLGITSDSDLGTDGGTNAPMPKCLLARRHANTAFTKPREFLRNMRSTNSI